LPFLVGLVLAICVGLFATGVGLDKDRAFYPTVTIVIASLYVLFAVMGNAPQVLLVELPVSAAFIIAAVVGFKGSLWIVVAALAAHGAQDFVHLSIIANPGVPEWWPAFCGMYDIAAAVYLAWLIWSDRVRAAS
jgi:hypothetical protein